MGRALLDVLAPFLLPFAAYAAYLVLRRRYPFVLSAWSRGPLAALVIAGELGASAMITCRRAWRRGCWCRDGWNDETPDEARRDNSMERQRDTTRPMMGSGAMDAGAGSAQAVATPFVGR